MLLPHILTVTLLVLLPHTLTVTLLVLLPHTLTVTLIVSLYTLEQHRERVIVMVRL